MTSECAEALLEKGKVRNQTGPDMCRLLLPLPVEESQPHLHKNEVDLSLVVEVMCNEIFMSRTLFQNVTGVMTKVTSQILVQNEVL